MNNNSSMKKNLILSNSMKKKTNFKELIMKKKLKNLIQKFKIFQKFKKNLKNFLKKNKN